MRTSKKGLDLIKSFEGLSLKAYHLGVEKYYTIGYGHNGADVKPDMVITKEQALTLLKKDLKRFENNVNKYHKIYKFNQNEFDALVSFAYNVGSIDQLTDYGKRTKEVIAQKMLLYTKSGGKHLEGLRRRRLKEHRLYLEMEV